MEALETFEISANVPAINKLKMQDPIVVYDFIETCGGVDVAEELVLKRRITKCTESILCKSRDRIVWLKYINNERHCKLY